jgi:uncharacterized damage-inducible protein DinB
MKSYFTRLFEYDRFANLQTLNLILQADASGKPVQLMAHLIAAQQTWLKRCEALPSPVGPLWPDTTPVQMTDLINEVNNDWVSYLNSLQPHDFNQVVSYKNTKGENFKNTLSDILAHVINHGTHHRAQAGQFLKQDNTPLPVSDYILYVRNLNKTP